MRISTAVSLGQTETIAMPSSRLERNGFKCMAKDSVTTSSAAGSEMAAVAKHLSDAIEALDRGGFTLAAAHAETALCAFLAAWSGQSDASFTNFRIHE